MSSNCFYLHNEARLSILLISERRKSKSALDKQLPPPPNLHIFSLNAGFSALWSSREHRDPPRTPPQRAWVLGAGVCVWGVLPLFSGCSGLGALPGAGGGGRGMEVSEWELERIWVLLGLEMWSPGWNWEPLESVRE